MPARLHWRPHASPPPARRHRRRHAPARVHGPGRRPDHAALAGPCRHALHGLLGRARARRSASFAVDVVDVIDGVPGEDGARIIVTASGPAVDPTGIGPGFSGSPIYCPDARQRAAQHRRDLRVDRRLRRQDRARDADRADARPTRSTRRSRRAGASLKAKARAGARSAGCGEGTKPLAAPLTISGVSAQARPRAGARPASKVGRPVIAVPAGPLGSFPPQTLRPGAAVSAGYSSGDLRIGAIGTVAYTDAGRVWAFGHSFEARRRAQPAAPGRVRLQGRQRPQRLAHRRLVQARRRRPRPRHADQRRVLGDRRAARRSSRR